MNTTMYAAQKEESVTDPEGSSRDYIKCDRNGVVSSVSVILTDTLEIY